MAKFSRQGRSSAQPRKAPGFTVLIIKGVLVSLVVSLTCVLLLSLISLVTESLVVEDYLRYILVGVTMLSIFSGGVYAARRAGSMGLVIGMAVGVIYVIISLAVGMEISSESLSFWVLVNKFIAGMAAGALGGLVGVNL